MFVSQRWNIENDFIPDAVDETKYQKKKDGQLMDKSKSENKNGYTIWRS